MKTMICVDCGVEKSIEDFYVSKTSKLGRHKRCKPCHFEMTKKSAEKAKIARKKLVQYYRSTPLTAEELRASIHYDPETGIFTSAKNTGHRKIGQVLGTPSRTGAQKNTRYITLNACGRLDFGHRLAVLYMAGSFPDGQVDHIDGDGLNNAWSNLRVVDGFENQRNIPLRKANKTGIHGVRIVSGKFSVSIGVNNKTVYLGSTDDFFEACCLRKSAENQYGFHPNHGRKVSPA